MTFALGLACLILCAVTQQVASQPIEKREIATGRRYAVVVGVRQAHVDGRPLKRLDACLRDANAVATALEGNGYDCVLLHDETQDKPTLTSVMVAVQETCKKTGATDQVLVYLTSHGGMHDGTPCIFLADGPIRLGDIKKCLAESNALVRVVLLDACRGEKQRGFATESREFRDVHVVLSCRPDEYSLASSSGLSIFTEVFLEALGNCRADRTDDGHITLDEALWYLDEFVPERANRLVPGHSQNPTRTVVDPRSNNPILASCQTLPANDAVAVREEVCARRPNDLILPREVVGRISLGMRPSDMRQNMGEPTNRLTLNQEGYGSCYYQDVPEEGASVHIQFRNGLVSSVSVHRPLSCDRFDAAVSCQRFRARFAGRGDTEVGPELHGLTPQSLFDALGCPTNRLTLNQEGYGSCYYQDVPEEGASVHIQFRNGLVSSVSVHRPR